MAKRCDLCGKGPVAGRSFIRRGKAKKEGGVGKKVVRANRRRFMPNLQRIRALVNGKRQVIRVCTKCMKKGRVVRAAA